MEHDCHKSLLLWSSILSFITAIRTKAFYYYYSRNAGEKNRKTKQRVVVFGCPASARRGVLVVLLLCNFVRHVIIIMSIINIINIIIIIILDVHSSSDLLPVFF
jgi:hypothetical protein